MAESSFNSSTANRPAPDDARTRNRLSCVIPRTEHGVNNPHDCIRVSNSDHESAGYASTWHVSPPRLNHLRQRNTL
jgi:hypothetical protein